jgi:hypothetical protein
MPFKVLHRSFVFLRRSFCFECAQIPSLAGLRIRLPRIQSIATRLKFSDHVDFPFREDQPQAQVGASCGPLSKIDIVNITIGKPSAALSGLGAK